MYLKECFVENVGPLEQVDLTFPFSQDGTPKPLVLVGRNGSGKSILLSHIADALIEFAKAAYTDVVLGQGSLRSPYFKTVGGENQRAGASFGIALLRFSHEEADYYYVDKSGELDPSHLRERLEGRFAPTLVWPSSGGYKSAPIPEDIARQYFRTASVCYFPSARHERPHWLNTKSMKDDPIFRLADNMYDQLDKPVLVESAAQENKQWLLDVLLDSMVELEPRLAGEPPTIQYSLGKELTDFMLLRESRINVEEVLKKVLQDESARLGINHRNSSSYRLHLRIKDDQVVPSIDNLSAGQANLFNLFCTIIRYADRGDINKSFRLHEIEGMVLVDEMEAQAHTELQYEILPQLLKMFPKVQFILTSHSPLFLLGMEKVFGSDGFQIVEMPSGHTISTERFSEFERSWNYYRRTTSYEHDMEQRLAATSKPLVFTEGETDCNYITTALDLLGRSDLLNAIDIQWIGTQGQQGATNTGDKALNNALTTLKANPDLTHRRVLFLYDSDTSKPADDFARMSVRTLPRNETNPKVKKGIENLLPANLFEPRFYVTRHETTDYGEDKSIERFNKTAFCHWICDERRHAGDFERFEEVIAILDEFLNWSGEPIPLGPPTS